MIKEKNLIRKVSLIQRSQMYSTLYSISPCARTSDGVHGSSYIVVSQGQMFQGREFPVTIVSISRTMPECLRN